MEQWLESLPEVLANISTPLGYYVTSHNCYVLDINVLFRAYRCPSCDTFLNRAPYLERHLITCSERVKHVYAKNVYQLCETLFDKLQSFGIPYTDNEKLFSNLAIFDFESICVEDESFKDTETTTWIGKHIPISVSIPSNLIQEPIFLCDPTPRDLVLSSIDALENLATQNTANENELPSNWNRNKK